MRPPHQGEHPGGRVGVGEGRDAGAVRGSPRRAATDSPPIQLASTGLPWMWAYCRELLGGRGRVGHRLRGEDHQQPVDARIGGGDFERLGISRRRRRRPGCRSGCVAPGRRQERVEGSPAGRGGASASSPPAVDQRVGGQDAGPAGIGDDRQARARAGRGCLARTSAMSKRSEIESTRSTPTRRKAASSTSSLPASEPVCDAAAFAAASVRPALITMIGLVSATSRAAERNAARRRSTPCRSRCTWCGVVAQVVDQVAPADVEHRADRDERAEADVVPQAPVEDRPCTGRRSG